MDLGVCEGWWEVQNKGENIFRINTRKEGKIMPRIQKENIKTPFFHIMVQGNNKEYIFNSTEDVNKYLEIMKKS